jgi:hypothetical protein
LPTILAAVFLTRLRIVCAAPLYNGIRKPRSRVNGAGLACVRQGNERAGDEHCEQQFVHFDLQVGDVTLPADINQPPT